MSAVTRLSRRLWNLSMRVCDHASEASHVSVSMPSAEAEAYPHGVQRGRFDRLGETLTRPPKPRWLQQQPSLRGNPRVTFDFVLRAELQCSHQLGLPQLFQQLLESCEPTATQVHHETAFERLRQCCARSGCNFGWQPIAFSGPKELQGLC